jgi:dipeptidyl-peptidase-4
MLKRSFSLIIAISIFSISGYAQKANFQLAEKLSSENMRKMISSTSVRPNWLKDSDIFWYQYKTGDGENYYIVDASKRSKKLLFDNQELGSELTLLTQKPYNPKELPIKNIDFKKSKTTFTFQIDSINFKYNWQTKQLDRLGIVDKDSLKNFQQFERWANYSPDSTWIVFAKNHNLFLIKAADLKVDKPDTDKIEIQLTEDGERWYSYARSDEDTTKNKRVPARARWFENSKKLYVVKSDERKVDDLFVVQSLNKPRPKLETYRYTMAGDKNIPEQELIVFEVEARKRIDIHVEKWKDQSIGGTNTIKSSNDLFFVRTNRSFSEMDICVANSETGETKVLFTEISKPSLTDNYSTIMVLNDGKDLVWRSDRDGWGHLYRYDKNGRMTKRLTNGFWVVGRVSQIDSTNSTLYFSAWGREKEINPYFDMYYKVDFKGNGPKLLTPENATHSFSMSETNKYFVDTYSTVTQVPKSVLRDSDGKVIMELEETDISRLVAAGWKPPEPFVVKAADDMTDNYGVMWKPFDFDSTKKYPIIAFVYPGPQTESVPITFSTSHQASLAQLGFIVVAVGARGGSPKRSKYYHSYGYGNNRDYPLEDNKYALEQLARLHPFIDIERVGIYGHSGGGNMTAAAMFKYPDFYKVGVSSAGNHDNNIYNRWWGESHYGVKEVKKKKKKDTTEVDTTKVDTTKIEKKQGALIDEEKEKKKEEKEEIEEEIEYVARYDENASIAKNLKGHLLLVHGEIDNNVHPANTLRVVDALIKAGKRFDFMLFPGKRHGYGDFNKYVERMRWYYFAEHLLGDYRNNVEIYNYGSE